jgi:hypothetical protein
MATKRTTTSSDEKFTNQDFDLFKAIDAVDAKNYSWFSQLTPEQQRKFSPYMLLHWTSAVKKDGDVGRYYVMSADANANKYLFDDTVQNHPELQWLMLCATSPGIGKQYHSWIPHLNSKVATLKDQASKKEVRDYFTKVFSGSEVQISELAEAYCQSQHHEYCLAEMYPNMKLEDIKVLASVVTAEDIKKYEAETGN